MKASNEMAIIVIPVRMASSRFPNKPLVLINGHTMLERVWRIGMAVGGVDEVIIATGDESLKAFAENFGAKVVLTSHQCLTGTDRVAEVASLPGMHRCIFFNLQGDAVLTPPWVIESVIQEMLLDATIQIATPAVQLTGRALADFIVSKKEGSSTGTCVVFNKKRDALYFSKALIPFSHDENLNRNIFRHIGLYGYRMHALRQLSQLKEDCLERSEKLEQLRALENGIPIRVVPVDYRGRTHGSVDRPEDVAVIESIIEREGELV
jgi:3-deoxy-manno-octulosonate cytidylyltransferase (CMP-KDO synthetase)